jgi:hypothetical protein
VIYTAYIDVSGHHAGSPVMVMGGYVGRLGQWANFDAKFGALLRKNNLTYHHTKKLAHGTGEYKGWNEQRKARHVNKIQRLIEKNTICGFSVSLKHADYESHYLNGGIPTSVILDNKYGLCFRIFLTQLSNMFQRSLDKIELHLVQEDGDPGIGDSARVFESFKKFASPDLIRIVKSRTVANKKDFYGLQIADWIAFASFRAEQGTPQLTYYPPEATLQEASSLAGYKAPIFRWAITPDVLTEMKKRLIDHADHRKRHWQKNRNI